MSFAGFFATTFLAQASTGGTVQDPRAANLYSFGMLAFMIVVMYVLLFRPQQQKAKQLAQTMKSLKSGDKIVTSGGILGVVITVKDKSLTVRSGDTKLEILKSAVSEITERDAAAAA